MDIRIIFSMDRLVLLFKELPLYNMHFLITPLSFNRVFITSDQLPQDLQRVDEGH